MVMQVTGLSFASPPVVPVFSPGLAPVVPVSVFSSSREAPVFTRLGAPPSILTRAPLAGAMLATTGCNSTDIADAALVVSAMAAGALLTLCGKYLFNRIDGYLGRRRILNVPPPVYSNPGISDKSLCPNGHGPMKVADTNAMTLSIPPQQDLICGICGEKGTRSLLSEDQLTAYYRDRNPNLR